MAKLLDLHGHIFHVTKLEKKRKKKHLALKKNWRKNRKQWDGSIGQQIKRLNLSESEKSTKAVWHMDALPLEQAQHVKK